MPYGHAKNRPEIARPRRWIAESARRHAAGRAEYTIVSSCRFPRASGSRRRQPATSTSAAPARRSSTGCSRGGTAACSCCASKTPTSSARRRTWWRAFSTACDGSGSTGTRARWWTVRSRRTSSRSGWTIYRAPAERLVADGRAYYCYCTPDELKARREAAEASTGGWKYDRVCCRSERRRHRRARARGPAARRSLQGARRRHQGGRSRPRPHRVRQRAHRGLRHPALRSVIRPITCRSCPTMWR